MNAGSRRPIASTLRDMGERISFKPAELPDYLDPSETLGLCRHLCDIGFLTLVRPGRP